MVLIQHKPLPNREGLCHRKTDITILAFIIASNSPPPANSKALSIHIAVCPFPSAPLICSQRLCAKLHIKISATNCTVLGRSIPNKIYPIPPKPTNISKKLTTIPCPIPYLSLIHI